MTIKQIKLWLQSLLSRKFIIVVVATVMVWLDKIEDSTWIWVVAIYLGVNVAQKFSTNGGGDVDNGK